MKKLLIFVSFFVLLVSTACGMTVDFDYQTIKGSGHIITESRDVSDFEQVEVCCGMELYLTQSETESLAIEADDNLMAEIITSVSGNRLEIKYRQMNNNIRYQPSQAVRLYLTVKDLTAVSLSGGGYFETETLRSDAFNLSLSGGSDAWIADLSTGAMDVNISGGGRLKAGTIEGHQTMMGFSGGSDAQIESLIVTSAQIDNSGSGSFEVEVCQADHLDLNLSGGSDADMPALTAETLNIKASGGGTTKMAGTVTEQDISLSGGSAYKAGDLQSERTDFSASGGGDSMVWATETLTVHLVGGSSLSYYGNPQVLEQSISGGGDLNSLGDH